MESKLGLDFKKVEYARGLAMNIAYKLPMLWDTFTWIALSMAKAMCLLWAFRDLKQVYMPIEFTIWIRNSSKESL